MERQCRFFQKGKCSKGDNCEFLHSYSQLAQNSGIKAICKFFQRGKCTKGDNCKFQHSSTQLAQNSQVQKVCVFFQKGECIRGDECKFKHSRSILISSVDSNEEKSNNLSPVASGSTINTINSSDDEILIDSENHSSSNSETLSEISVQIEKNFLLKISSRSVCHESFNEFIEREKKLVLDIFESDLKGILNKYQEIDKKNRDRQFVVKDEPIEKEYNLIFENLKSFQSEMKRLATFNIPNGFLKNAYRREFKRAKAKLPFYSFRENILDEIEKNDFLIIIGQTGSGKTTQVPQYLLEAGYAQKGKIVCTQPRKIAAISVSKRIAFELDCEHTNLVDYKIGRCFQSKTEIEKRKEFKHWFNKLLLMTDKMLLKEYKKDKLLKKYSCIIIDEAHERSLYTDILLCELKNLVHKRKETKKPLKLIIMSATIDETKISNYFNGCKVIKVPGQTYPVRVFYEKVETDYVSQSIRKLKYLIDHQYLKGHCLVFLPSLEDINKAVNRTKRDLIRSNEKYICLPLHGSMNMEEQSEVFEDVPNKFKIIFTTNIAETSITVNGIRVIIDSGRAKERIYDQERNISILKLKFINQSSAQQRKGRAGRMQPGDCYRLYELNDFENMDFSMQPEILRMHLGVVILELLSFGVENILEYDLIDKPDNSLIIKSLDKLESLGFVENGKLTDIGKKAAELNVEPMISRMIIEGFRLGVGNEMMKIASMMTVTNILYKKELDKNEKNQLKIQTCCENGDLFTLLSIYQEFDKVKYKHQKQWCDDKKFNFHALKLAKQAYAELFGSTTMINNEQIGENEKNDLIMQSICSGLHSQLAFFNGKINEESVYKLHELNQEAFFHHESVLNVLSENEYESKYILFTDLVRTDRLYMRNLTPVYFDILLRYTRINLSELLSEVKEEIVLDNLNIKLIEKLKENNGELLELLEESIGSALILKKDTLKAYVKIENIIKCQENIRNFIGIAKSRLENELYLYRPADFDNSTRIVLRSGLKVVTILLKNEYIRINFDTTTQFTTRRLEELFRSQGNIIDLRFNRSYSSKITGYVIFEKSEIARKAFENLSGHVEHSSTLNLNPAYDLQDSGTNLELRNKSIRAFWYLTEPTGDAYLRFKSGTDLNTTRRVLSQLDYNQSNIVQNNQIKISNVTRNNKYLDEYDFKKQIKLHIPEIESCSFVRKKIENSISLETNDIPYQTMLITSLFSQSGEIDKLVIIPFHTNQKGDVKPQTTVNVKYKENKSVLDAMTDLNGKIIPQNIQGFGYMHVETNFLYEYKVPSNAANLLHLTDLINTLNQTSTCKIDHRVNYDQKDNDLVILRSVDQTKLDECAVFLDKILKPISVKLAYFKFDKLRKYLNKDNTQNKLQDEHGIFIHKNAKLNQISLYGRKNVCQKVIDDLLKDLDAQYSNYVDIPIRSFKAIMGNNGKTFRDLCETFRGEIKINYKTKTLSFYSKESQIEEFKKRVNEIQNEYIHTNSRSNINEICEICLGDIESKFELVNCSHSFCKECLVGQLTAFDEQNPIFNCVKCDKEILICDINELIDFKLNEIDNKSSKALNNFLIVNFEFKICSACNQIFKKRLANQTNCEHCEEKIRREKQKNEQIRRQNEETKLSENYINSTFKKCPKCNTPIEKNEGCNHMTCLFCKCHFCWKCNYDALNENDIPYFLAYKRLKISSLRDKIMPKRIEIEVLLERFI